MQPRPRGLVAAETQYLLQVSGTRAVLLARDVPNSPKPKGNGLRVFSKIVPAVTEV